MTASQTTSASYEVGYRKPPRHTQFRKGQSGNPGGRPRRLTARLEDLALYEAYRTTIVMEDGHAIPMPAIQAVLRSQLQSAAGGNVRAQRDVLAMIQHIELVRSLTSLRDEGDTDDVVDDTDAIDATDNDIDDTADALRDDAGSADDDEPARQQSHEIDTHGEMKRAERGVLHPPLKGEGRTAEGSPGWGDGRTTHSDAEFAEPLSPPPGPLKRADLPLPAGGGEAWTPSLTSGPGSGQRRGPLPRRNDPARRAGVQRARPQTGRRRSPAVDAGKTRERLCGSARRSPGRTRAVPGPASGGHARAPGTAAERDKKLKTRC